MTNRPAVDPNRKQQVKLALFGIKPLHRRHAYYPTLPFYLCEGKGLRKQRGIYKFHAL